MYTKEIVYVIDSFVISSKALPELRSSLVTERRRCHDNHLTPSCGLGVSTSVVERWLSRRSLRGGVTPRHTAIDYKVGTVDEAAFVAGKEKYRLGLLNSLAEATTGEVNLAAVTLGLVITQPVLEEGSAVSVSMLILVTRL
jgi:hypothetical protein